MNGFINEFTVLCQKFNLTSCRIGFPNQCILVRQACTYTSCSKEENDKDDADDGEDSVSQINVF